jgi:hypothetical protein
MPRRHLVLRHPEQHSDHLARHYVPARAGRRPPRRAVRRRPYRVAVQKPIHGGERCGRGECRGRARTVAVGAKGPCEVGVAEVALQPAAARQHPATVVNPMVHEAPRGTWSRQPLGSRLHGCTYPGANSSYGCGQGQDEAPARRGQATTAAAGGARVGLAYAQHTRA